MGQQSGPPEGETGGVANVKTEAGKRPGGAQPGSAGGTADRPQGSGDSPKPHGDPLKPVLER